MPIYLQASGAQGNVSLSGYENWIEIQEVVFSGINQGVEQRPGRMYDRIQGGPNFGLIHLRKVADSSSPFWFEYASSNRVIAETEIDYVTTGNQPFSYQILKLTNAFVSHYSQEHQGNIYNAPLEFITLGYDSLECSYIPRSADNSQGSPIRTGYDVSKGIPM